MPSLISFFKKFQWDACHAMLDRGKGDVNERDEVRHRGAGVEYTRTRHVNTPPSPHLCLW
jgi:hypothetical protein